MRRWRRGVLKIIRGFELTRAKRDLYVDLLLGQRRFPIQVIWRELDPSLTIAKQGEEIHGAAGVTDIVRLPATSTPPEGPGAAVAESAARLVAG